jgi:DNA polymerase-3 subunit delta
MTAIKSGDADRVIQNPRPGVFLWLVFGADSGLVAERVRAILARSVDDPKDPFQLVAMSGDDVAADPLRLVDEAHAIPMFGERKAIAVEAHGKSILPALDLLLKAPPARCAITVEAGALKRDHALRKWFEKETAAAAIECFPDGPRELAALIDREMAEAGLAIEPAARELLVSLLGQDRLSTRSELEKLATYAHGAGRITVGDVEAIVADASALVLDHAIDGAFRGAFAAVETTTEKVFAENSDVNLLLGSALRHATMLHRARLSLDGGGGDLPGFYGPRKAAAEQQLKLWDAPRLAKAVTTLGEAVGRARREPRLARAIATRALWAVALAARPR